MEIYQKIYYYIRKYLESRLSLADVNNLIAQVQNEIEANNSRKEKSIKKKFETV